MKRLVLITVAATLAAAVPYSDVRAVERAIDRRFQGHEPTDPIEVLGSTLGVYVEGTGAVFNSEVILVQGPGLSPFRPELPKEEIAKIHDRKRARLPELRKLMQDSMVTAATMLATVPAQEEIVYGVSMFYQPWEDASGLPRQLVMRAKRQALLDYEKGALKSLESAVRLREY
jgi:hypothetical protein